MEHKGLLSLDSVQKLGRYLFSIQYDTHQIYEMESTKTNISFHDQISAINLAAQCLLKLDQIEDCMVLLEPIISVVETTESDIKMLLSSRITHLFDSSSTDMSLLAGNEYILSSSTLLSYSYHFLIIYIYISVALFFIAGKCFDLLDDRPQALLMFFTALQLDITLLEIVDYVVSNGLLGTEDKKIWFQKSMMIAKQQGLTWLTDYYK